MSLADGALRLQSGAMAQALVAAVACLLVGAPFFLIDMPMIVVAAALLPLCTLVALRLPFIMCLGFMIFSFFRIHEVFPLLGPLRIPQGLALASLAGLAWHIGLKRSIAPFWSRELTVFGIFFLLVTIGVATASNKPLAAAYWSDTYSKIGLMTVAVAWLTRRPKDFAIACHAIVCAGMIVAAVTLYNKANSIGLVEGTRVTIGRDIGSVLGDPNDLSLVLLFPLSFAAALLVQRIGWLSAIFGAIGIVMITAAIVATQSRGGLLGLVAVSAVMANRVIKRKSILIVVGILGAFVLFGAAGISQRSSGGAAEQGIDESSMGRIYAWGAATRMATTRPLTGVGVNNFVSNYYFYSDHWDGNNHAVHSTWFGVLAESGFPGFVAFISMITVMFAGLARAGRSLDSPSVAIPARAACLGTFAGLVGFCVSGTFLTQGFTWPVYILLGLTAAIGRFAKCEGIDAKR